MASPIVFQQQAARAVSARQAATAVAAPDARGPTLAFDPATPTIIQTGAWQCSATSTAWMLRSLGHPHSQDDVVELLGPDHINPDLGLMFGDGRGLVGLLASVGLKASNQQPVTFDDVLALAGRVPVAMGGAAYYDWVGVRGREGDELQLANPAPGWRGVYQTMSRARFGELGPFAGEHRIGIRLLLPRVRGETPSLVAPVKAPSAGTFASCRPSDPGLKKATSEVLFACGTCRQPASPEMQGLIQGTPRSNTYALTCNGIQVVIVYTRFSSVSTTVARR
jgi:hypothetical protein